MESNSRHPVSIMTGTRMMICIRFSALCLAVSCLPGIACLAATIRVPADQPTIQAGIDAAADGDIVMVADGTYTGDGNRDIRFQGKAITVKSENGPETCIIDSEGTDADRHRGFIFQSGENEHSVLENVTIQNGYHDSGGGICCYNYSCPLISGCFLRNNEAISNGGAMDIDNSDPSVRNCVFTGNLAGQSGGGICIAHSGVTCENCSFTRNIAPIGGGMSIFSSPLILGCSFIENDATSSGGGLFCNVGSFPRIINTVFLNNRAKLGGGISSVFIANCCIINCSITGNRASKGGGLFYEYLCSYYISNSVIWNNFPDQLFPTNQGFSVNYSNIQGGWPGPGNIDKDPLFVGTGDHPLTLSSFSPCIDAGTDRDAPETDIRGFDRPMGGAPDMGAYEYQGGWPFTTRVYVRMPSHQFTAGDTVNCRIDIWNAEQKLLTGHSLFVLLDVLGSVYWAPGFTIDPDWYVIDVPAGLSQVTVLPDFVWPEDAGTIDGIVWYAALANHDMTALVGEVGVFDFGGSEEAM